ncbi:Endoplasmic reticulum-Golgi intermediate compartment protein [Reticulomyxa filosa]|uniref:Endoplasmic reticulum-Golgi intermediate compartment protein n=1 Tax=Reticulomyxa filosa TaxID=46433 RepID=X6M8I1_RETFI|nr:Endoplasmic reticulum-Golgi intermediate compartment protein [Reticulomyxa filosa]|eukprot:ETO10224.1 Endoplasmic reticulum-Golgi intermediate compartment protein [Reticulomyxa filosa]
MDVSGEQQVHVQADIRKYRLDRNGRRMNNRPFISGFFVCFRFFKKKICIYIFFVLLKKKKNSLKGLQTIQLGEEQNEGCRIEGHLHVQKVEGNFHLALGAAHNINGRHVHQFVLSDIPKFNCSHTIHHLSFGDPFPQQVFPLNGISHVITEMGGGVFQYYLKIIPTEYISPTGHRIYSNQYWSSYKYNHIRPSSEHERTEVALPGVFFIYEMNEYMVRISRQRPSLTDFLVNLCAIVGGVYAVSGLLDSIAFNLTMINKAKHAIKIALTKSLDV